MSAVRARVRYMLSFYTDHRRHIALILALTVVNAALGVAPPAVLAHVVRIIDERGDAAALSRCCVLLLVLFAASALSYAGLQAMRVWLNLTLERRFRQRAFEALLRLSPRFFGRMRTGDLVTRLTDDITNKLAWFSCSGVFRTFEAACKLILGLAAMVYLSPPLALLTVLPMPFIGWVFYKSKKSVSSRFDERQQSISSAGDVIESAMSGIRVVKAYRHEGTLVRAFTERVLGRRRTELRAASAEVLMGSLYAQTMQVATVVCLVAGGFLVERGVVDRAAVVGMMAYVALLVFPMFDFGQFLVASLRASVSIDRLLELEREVPEITEPAPALALPTPRGELELAGVSLTLTGREVLRNIDLVIPAGARVAIAGPVGAGKSCLLRLIPRLLDPDAGRIALDGIPIRQIALDDLRRCIGYVPQDAVLFSGTISDNIRANRPAVTDVDMAWAVKVARLGLDLERMGAGLDTVVGVRGLTLSGGQRARVSLARALVGRPRVLVMDDCTASLDAATEAELWRELETALPGTTVLLSTHRTATLETADLVIVLDAGRLVQTGTHAELLASGGTYAELYRHQQLAESLRV